MKRLFTYFVYVLLFIFSAQLCAMGEQLLDGYPVVEGWDEDYLVASGWDPNEKQIYRISFTRHNRIALLVQLGNTGTIVRIGLNDPLPKSTKRVCALHALVHGEGIWAIEEILKRGGSANVSDAELGAPLHYAVRCDNCAAVKQLIKHSAYVNSTLRLGEVDEKTPLDLAYETRDVAPGIISALKEYGGRTSKENKEFFSELIKPCDQKEKEEH